MLSLPNLSLATRHPGLSTRSVVFQALFFSVIDNDLQHEFNNALAMLA